MPIIINPYASSGRTFTFVGACASTGSSLNFSALDAGAIAAGDLAVYLDVVSGAGTPTAVTPSGFGNHINVVGAAGGDDERGMISSAKLTGAETSITGMSDVRTNKVGLVFRPSRAFTSISAAGINAGAFTSGDPAGQVCDPSAEVSAVVLIGSAFVDQDTAAFSGFSPAADGQVTNTSAALRAGYKVYNSAPQSTSIDMADLNNTNWLSSLYFTVVT